MNRWRVLVQWLRSSGGFSHMHTNPPGPRDFSEVEVMADTATEASLIANQMVGSREGIEPVRTWVEGPL